MTILNISIFTFLIGLGLFSYTIYERSLILSSEEQKPKTENLNYKNDKKVLETSQNEKSLLDIRNSLQSEILAKKHEIKFASGTFCNELASLLPQFPSPIIPRLTISLL